jgi:iron complex transport system substrate-binding protein
LEIVDQIGNIIVVEKEPRRIVCLVPSITELLHDFGLGDRVIGITKFCCHPKHWKQEKTIIGGTKNVHLDKVKTLLPDLIIANQEENVKEQIVLLQTFCPVFVSKVDTPESVLDLVQLLGNFFGNPIESAEIYLQLLDAYHDVPTIEKPKTFAYLIWKNPFMAAGNDTYIHHFIQHFGFQNVVISARYPEVNLSNYASLDYLFLSSEPFPFKQKDLEELQDQLGPKTKVVCVDGEFFSWYGTRILHMEEYKKSFLAQIQIQ